MTPEDMKEKKEKLISKLRTLFRENGYEVSNNYCRVIADIAELVNGDYHFSIRLLDKALSDR